MVSGNFDIHAYSPSEHEPGFTLTDLPAICRVTLPEYKMLPEYETTAHLQAIPMASAPSFPKRNRVHRWYRAVIRVWKQQRTHID